MIAVIDYGRGNLFSISQALQHIGVPHEITSSVDRLEAADRILLPGVGAFPDAVAALRELSLFEPIGRMVRDGKPLIGICLGMQLLATRGEEFGSTEGFGFIPGVVVRLPDSDKPGAVRIPNMGWRRLVPCAPSPLFDGVAADAHGYFIHSYALMAQHPEDVAATITVNGQDVTSIVRRGNVTGFQFHPEKSGPAGLRLLANALRY